MFFAAQNVHYDGFWEPNGGEQFHATLLLEVSSVYGAFKAAADCRVNVVGHMWPLELASHSVILAKLDRVSSQFRILS